MGGRIAAWVLAVLLAGGAATAQAGGAADEGVVKEVLTILRDRGLVEEGEYQRLVSRNARYEEERKSWLPRLEFWGDFRGRHESFWYSRDETGSERDNRFRGRYRLRLNAKADVNDWASFYAMLVSGSEDNRSTNQTFGSGVDFDTDPIRLDRAYVQLAAPESWVPLPGGSTKLQVGKLPNPFVWKVGQDFMLWDHDINPEGLALQLTAKPGENLGLFANAGYFVIDENSRASDPHLWAGQLGAHFDASESVRLGARVTYYQFNSLDPAFVGRGVDGTGGVTDAGGNIADGLTGDAAGDDSLQVGELGAYLTWEGLQSWPMTLYGNWARNFSAESSVLSPAASEEDTAWGLGFELGDKKRYARLGVGYWHVEANAFPSQFIDSNLFDGHTNREGFAFYGSRELFRNTDLNLTVFVGDEIEDDLPAFGDSVSDADRVRMQADVLFKF